MGGVLRTVVGLSAMMRAALQRMVLISCGRGLHHGAPASEVE